MSKDNSIQYKIDQLNTKMAWFHGEEFNLDEALERYQEVEQLSGEIESTLVDMKNKVEILKKKFD